MGVFDGIPQDEQNQIMALKISWESLTGYTVDIPDWMLAEAALNNVQNLYDFGRYMAQHIQYSDYAVPGATIIPEAQAAAMPWAFYGMEKEAYAQTLSGLNTVWTKMTGESAMPQSWIDKAITGEQGGRGLMTVTGFEQQLLNDKDIQKTYGWLKYGMDYRDFQQKKLSWGDFGKNMSDQEAVLQLQYNRAAQGPNVSAVAYPVGQQQQQRRVPTGAGESVVR